MILLIVLYIVLYAVGLAILYWIIRLAVRHALMDVQGRSGPPRVYRDSAPQE